MARINILDIQTSNKIAAGEVVERPVSVVKELVENSLDANSKNITIEIKEGGQKLIKVIDDGEGIHEDDLKKAFTPHGTSKINSVEDIFSINTLGFRGEALPSIASVSKVTIKSKSKECDLGKELILNMGEEVSFLDSPISKGTQIEVLDLFFNVPARLKFLKTTTREGSLIVDLVNKLALANPDISFKLFNNNKKVVNTYGNGSLLDTIRSVYDKKTSENLIYFEEHKDTVSVYGYIGNETLARGSRNNEIMFVNKRYIKNKAINVAVENAFKSFNVTNKFPFYIMFIEIYSELIDVNIHPTKSEIRFKDERFVFKTVFDSVHKALKEAIEGEFNIEEEEIPFKINKYEVNQLSLDNEIEKLNSLKETISNSNIEFNKSNKEINLPVDFLSSSLNKDNNEISKTSNSLNNNLYNNTRENNYLSDNLDFKKNIEASNKVKESLNSVALPSKDMKDFTKDKIIYNGKETYKENSIYNKDDFSINKDIYNEKNINKSVAIESNERDMITKKAKFPKLKVIGQFNKTYIIAEYDSILYLIDQHAAHEKIYFEKYRKNIEEAKIEIQPLALPILLELTLDDFAYFIENKEVFKDAGFKIEEFGEDSVRISEVPYFLGKLNAKELFLSIINNLKNLGSGKTLEVKFNKIASLACKAAVKANDVLSLLEMESLLEDLRYLEDPFNCPHGRPTIIKFTSYELDKKFKRIL